MKQIITFLSEVKTQLTKISWPKKDTLIQLTFVVIFISILAASILGSLDYLFTQTIGWLTALKN